jgi:Tol biopolymer transport system component
VVVATAIAGGLVLAGAVTSQAAFHLNLVSRTSDGASADGDSTIEANGGSISRDGSIVAFASSAANLPHGDGSTAQCYVHNLKTGKTRLVSVTSAGEPAAGTGDPKISANGRFVAFFGSLGEGGNDQVWVHDLKTGKTRLASRAANGDPAAGGNSAYPSISSEGRFVAFESYAANMPGASENGDLVYVRDMKRGKTLVGSKTSDGHPAFGDVYGQALSSDGRVLAFYSFDPDLPHGTGHINHVYVRNLRTGKVALVDKASDGTIADASSDDASISGDGRFVAFATDGNNLPGSGGNGREVYVRDLKRGKTSLVTRNTAGVPAQDDSDYAQPSSDGRYVTFSSNGANLPGANGALQIYIRDLRRGMTRLVSKAASGEAGDVDSEYPSISLDGDWIAFQSAATNLGGNPSVENAFRAGPIG